MENGHQPPESRKPTRQAAYGISTPMPSTPTVDNRHLLPEPLARQIGPAVGDERIGQRDVRQPSATVPPAKTLHLHAADATLAIIYNHVGGRPLLGRRYRFGEFG